MRGTAAIGLIAALVGCGTEAQTSACHDLCTELTATCQLDAFPNPQSCEQGCEYNASQGADIGGQLLCVQQAACDTFAILECEHAYGVD